MPGEFLLDTSVLIPLFRGERSVQERLEQAERVFLPAIVLGELHFGAEGSERPAEQREKVREFAGTCSPLVCDAETARQYGRIKQALLPPGGAGPGAAAVWSDPGRDDRGGAMSAAKIVPRRAGYQGPFQPPERKPRRRRSSVGRPLRATVHKRPRQLADGKFEYALLDHPLITPTLFPPSRGEKGAPSRPACLSDLWLEDAGFLTGKRFDIDVSEGRLVLRTV